MLLVIRRAVRYSTETAHVVARRSQMATCSATAPSRKIAPPTSSHIAVVADDCVADERDCFWTQIGPIELSQLLSVNQVRSIVSGVSNRMIADPCPSPEFSKNRNLSRIRLHHHSAPAGPGSRLFRSCPDHTVAQENKAVFQKKPARHVVGPPLIGVALGDDNAVQHDRQVDIWA